MKKRLDIVITERGLAPSRTAAAALIMSGAVRCGEKILDKPGLNVAEDVELVLKNLPKYVSRGGDKLASVVDYFGVDFRDQIILDVGSSTGGFSDFALQHGATKVFCVDAGTSQLAYKLRQDPRVVVLERTDIRDVHANQLLTDQCLPDIAVVDVSFISIIKVLPSVVKLISQGAAIIALMKPQFEAGKQIADRYKGVIADELVRQKLIGDFEAAIQPDFEIILCKDSAIHGAEGNRERFYFLRGR